MKIIVHYLAFHSDQAFEFPTDLLNEPPTPLPPARNTMDILEAVFRQCNVVDGTEWIVEESRRRISRGDKGLRSMSVGDIVTFFYDGGKWESYLCEGCGWKVID